MALRYTRGLVLGGEGAVETVGTPGKEEEGSGEAIRSCPVFGKWQSLTRTISCAGVGTVEPGQVSVINVTVDKLQP